MQMFGPLQEVVLFAFKTGTQPCRQPTQTANRRARVQTFTEKNEIMEQNKNVQ